MALPPRPERLSDAEMGSLLAHQAKALAAQLKVDAVELSEAGNAQPAGYVERVIAPLEELQRATEPHVTKPEKLDVRT